MDPDVESKHSKDHSIGTNTRGSIELVLAKAVYINSQRLILNNTTAGRSWIDRINHKQIAGTA